MSSQAVLWGLAIDFWDKWGFRLMLIGAASGAITLVVSVLSSVILYHVSDFAQKELERETSRLSVEAEIARRDIAVANERALRAELELAKFKAPRVITPDQQVALVKRLEVFAGTPFVLAILHEPEPQSLMGQIERLLIEANWKQQDWSGGALQLDRPGKLNVGLVSAADVVVQLDKKHIPAWMPAVTEIVVGLLQAGITTRLETGDLPTDRNIDAVNIIVGKKQ